MSYLQERVQCPNCPPYKKASLSIDRAQGLYHCFRCGISGRSKNMARSVRILLSRGEIEWPEDYRPLRPSAPRSLGERAALRYLKNRGVTEVQITHFKIGYCPKGAYAQRIIVPLFRGTEMVYFVARSIQGAEGRKYLNPPIPKQGLIFKTFIGKVHRAVVTEGVFDAISVSAVMPSIAMLSKNPTEDQIREICESANELILMLDADAHKTALEVGERLSYYVPVRRVRLKTGDPANLNPRSLYEIFRQNDIGTSKRNSSASLH